MTESHSGFTYGKFPTYRKCPGQCTYTLATQLTKITLPTFEVASVKLFSVVDFPLDGYMPLSSVSGVSSEITKSSRPFQPTQSMDP